MLWWSNNSSRKPPLESSVEGSRENRFLAMSLKLLLHPELYENEIGISRAVYKTAQTLAGRCRLRLYTQPSNFEENYQKGWQPTFFLGYMFINSRNQWHTKDLTSKGRWHLWLDRPMSPLLLLVAPRLLGLPSSSLSLLLVVPPLCLPSSLFLQSPLLFLVTLSLLVSSPLLCLPSSFQSPLLFLVSSRLVCPPPLLSRPSSFQFPFSFQSSLCFLVSPPSFGQQFFTCGELGRKSRRRKFLLALIQYKSTAILHHHYEES